MAKAGGGAKLPAFIVSHLQGANVPPGASREFCALVKAIGESGSNHVRMQRRPRRPLAAQPADCRAARTAATEGRGCGRVACGCGPDGLIC